MQGGGHVGVESKGKEYVGTEHAMVHFRKGKRKEKEVNLAVLFATF